MEIKLIVLLTPLIIIIFLIFSTIKVIQENQRGAIYRLGKFIKIASPGVLILVPFVDKLRTINLNEKIPGWQLLTERQIEEMVKEILIYQIK